jgi:hypothetical protein
MIAALALALLVNAALAFWLLGQIHFSKPLKSLIFESVSHNRMDVYEAEFGRGYLDLDLASVGPDGKTELRSFHLRY